MKALLRLVTPLLAVVLLCQPGGAQATNYMFGVDDEGTATASDQNTADLSQPPRVENSICPQTCCDNGCGCCCCNDCCRYWYVDYEIQRMFGYTSYQFGSAPAENVRPYGPESKLNFSLDSTWTGLRLGVQRCNWDVHFEWLTPMVQHIDHGMNDYDWNVVDPRNDPARLDSLSHSSTRWNDGQQINIEADYKYSDCFLGMPIEVWPLAGFRFERLDMTAYAGDQLVSRNGAFGPLGPFDFQGDALTFNQQYYTGYIGAQLRKCIERQCRPPIGLVFQFDWGATAGYNIDHHLLRAGDRFTMDSTGGDTVHLGLCADFPVTCRLSWGLQADYLRIRTTGSHRLVNVPLGQDETWDNGVLVKSEQTDLTVYVQGNW